MVNLTFEEFTLININERRSYIYQQVAGNGSGGDSLFYTREDAIIESQGSAEKLNNGLQRWEHPLYGPRNKLAVYQIIEQVPIAESKALANPQVNNGAAFGGYSQVFIKKDTAIVALKLIGYISLRK